MENETLIFPLAVYIFLPCLILDRSGEFASNPKELILLELAPVWSVRVIETATHQQVLRMYHTSSSYIFTTRLGGK